MKTLKTRIKHFIRDCVPFGLVEWRRARLYGAARGVEAFPSNSNVGRVLYPDQKFYIIRNTPLIGGGLGYQFHTVLAHIIYAVNRGYTPLVDLENYRTWYNEDHSVNGTWNFWEYYFQQPSAYALDEVYRYARKILLGNFYPPEVNLSLGYTPQSYTAARIAELNGYIAKYCRLQPAIQEHIDRQHRSIFGEKKNILGVTCRGTAIVKKSYNKTPYHNKLADDEETLVQTRKLFDQWGMEYVFLSSQYLDTVEKFRAAFGERLLVTDRARLPDYYAAGAGYNEVADMRGEPPYATVKYLNRENDRYLGGLEYLTDVVLLSRCSALISSLNNTGIWCLELNNNRYQHRYFFELGITGKDGA
ncbi:MAG: hypothetical protein LBP75_01265 [Planctomycetota bacterium]|jgi:hypothetical protein|nr:hypothetical protein [Planctomycetota bacterium]